jgi:hypothetical protein
MGFNWLPLAGDAIRSGVEIYQINKRQQDMGQKRQEQQDEINRLKDNRTEIPNLVGQISNPFDNLSVATRAAEIQMEQSDIALANQSDIALANTLDTIRATGMGAGGATALAQAALQSKNAVAASIEKQEANNAQLAAQGEAAAQKMTVYAMEKEFGYQEERTNADLDYAADLESRYANAEYEASLQKEDAINRTTSEITSGFGMY